jgi:hypothetical protein
VEKYSFYFSRFKRYLSALLAGVALMIPVIGAVLASIIKVQPAQIPAYSTDTLTTVLHSWIFITSLFVAFLLLCLKWFFTYKKLTYDPTWILQFQKRFDDLEETRKKSALILKEYQGKMGDIEKYQSIFFIIEDVLDVFEDVGFYVKGDQISPEVAHHHFYHWVRGYWNTAHDYIEALRKKETKAYDHVEYLFEVLCTVEVGLSEEKRRQEKHLSQKDIDEFFEDEIGKEEQRVKTKRRKTVK